MIKLRDLLEDRPEDREISSVWITPEKYYGAKNSLHQLRYFHSREDAEKFASGNIVGPKIGRPQPKETPEKTDSVDYYVP